MRIKVTITSLISNGVLVTTIIITIIYENELVRYTEVMGIAGP